MEMTKESLRQICKEHKLYMTPHLNDKLYCNFKGFSGVANLEEYCNLKALFLEGNAIESLQGLPSLPDLKCLYAQQNLLTSLEGLGDGVSGLATLNVSSNQLTSLQHLESLPALRMLLCTDNQLEGAAAIVPVAACTALETVDLQNNRLAEISVLDVLRALPQLKCLYLKGNPLVSSLPSYRKAVIATIPTLAYLDDRPVFERERRCAEAWARGGLEAERQERAQCMLEEQAREQRNFQALQRIREEGYRKRRERLGLAPGTTDPFLDTVDDSEWQFEEEPEELRAARQRLAAYTAVQQDEPLPELPEGGGTSPGQATSLFERQGVEDDVKPLLEGRAASLAELSHGLAPEQPLENSNPNAAESTARAQPVAAQAAVEVPIARVTVTVRDSSCCGGPCKGGSGASAKKVEGERSEGDSDDEPGFVGEELGEGTGTGLAAAVAELAHVALRAGTDSEADSESVASEDAADLEALD